MMKHTLSCNIFVLATFFGLLPLVSCTVAHKTTNTSSNDKITNETPKIIFLNYSMVNDTIKQEYNISISCINTAPVFTTEPNTIAMVDSLYVYNVNANYISEDNVIISIDSII